MQPSMAKTKSASTIEGLFAESSNSEMREKLMLFGQFVGDWDILECRNLQKDGSWTTSRGELHWGWILDGRAVQDVWMSINEETPEAFPEGTTVRFYDARIDAWHSIWISPTQRVVQRFVGRKVGDEIVLEGESENGTPVKWIFFDIKPASFKWRAEEAHEDGKTWTLTEEMKIQRRMQKR